MADEIKSLVRLCERFPQLKAVVRGTGKARFVYAQSTNKAVELSVEPPGFWFEGWNVADEESDVPSDISTYLKTIQDVEMQLRQWLA
jgi:hypothetical protein